jgi:hypothetical protein
MDLCAAAAGQGRPGGGVTRMAVTPAVLALVVCIAAIARGQEPPKYYVALRETLEAPGLSTGLKAQVKPVIIDELRQRPVFVLELPDAPQDPVAFAEYLKRRGLKAYEINVRLTKLTLTVRQVRPDAPHRTIRVTLGASLFGTSLPAKSFAVGGAGESTVVVTAREESRKVIEQAKLEALRGAIQEAVTRMVKSLEATPEEPQPEKHRKKR